MGFCLAIWEPHPSRMTPPTSPPVRGGSESSHRTCQSSGVLLGRTGQCGQVPEHRPRAAAWTSAKSSHQEGSPGAAKVGEHQDHLVSSRPHCPASVPSAHLRDHSIETAQPVLCRDHHVPRLGFLGSLRQLLQKTAAELPFIPVQAVSHGLISHARQRAPVAGRV